jgi:ParB family chromosome partitioning protein
MNNKKESVLGRGLSDLFGTSNIAIINQQRNIDSFRYATSKESYENQVFELDLNNIKPCSTQPRTVFEENSLNELAESIKENGILQPIIVRQDGDKYEIIAGERRWRASKIAEKKTIPAIIKNLDDHKAFLISIIENLQRAELSPLEEAEIYNRLINEDYTHDQIASIVNKSRSHVSNISRLLNLSTAIKKMLSDNLLSVGHAKLLLSSDIDENLQNKLAKEIVEKSLSIRQTEDLIRHELGDNHSSDSDFTNSDSEISTINPLKHKKRIKISTKSEYDFDEIRELLKNGLKTEVSITNKQIIINYKSMVDLDRLLGIILN